MAGSNPRSFSAVWFNLSHLFPKVDNENTRILYFWKGFPGGSDGKASARNAGDLGSIPGLGRSSGEGNGNPLQYSCLENSMDGGAWWATVHGVAKSQTWLSHFTSTFGKFTFMPLQFYKRPTLVPVFYNCKKSEEDFHFSDKKVKSEKGIQHWFC